MSLSYWDLIPHALSPARRSPPLGVGLRNTGHRLGEAGDLRVYTSSPQGTAAGPVMILCHELPRQGAGAEDAGRAYPALAADANLASGDYVLQLLLEGRGAMPPLGRAMSDAQIADVINYVRSHFGNAFADAVSSAEVAAARAAAKARP